MTDAPFFSRQERFSSVGSTNDVVRGWLRDGAPEVCLAVTESQTAGRGRSGRSWQDRPGASLLLSLGFRPDWLAPSQVWRLAAVVSLAMADAAEESAGLSDGAIRLKWPNDLVIEEVESTVRDGRVASESRTVRKLAGVLGETSGLGGADPVAIVGIGVNVDWPRDAFPADLADTMTSLRDAAGGRPVDRVTLLDAFVGRVEPRLLALRDGRFPVADWVGRQLTTGRWVDLERADGVDLVHAVGVDADSGGLVIEDASAPRGERVVLTGEIVHLRVTPNQSVASGV